MNTMTDEHLCFELAEQKEDPSIAFSSAGLVVQSGTGAVLQYEVFFQWDNQARIQDSSRKCFHMIAAEGNTLLVTPKCIEDCLATSMMLNWLQGTR